MFGPVAKFGAMLWSLGSFPKTKNLALQHAQPKTEQLRTNYPMLCTEIVKTTNLCELCGIAATTSACNYETAKPQDAQD